jgi:hypothetical protein
VVEAAAVDLTVIQLVLVERELQIRDTLEDLLELHQDQMIGILVEVVVPEELEELLQILVVE